jgi:vitamin B12 transporter
MPLAYSQHLRRKRLLPFLFASILISFSAAVSYAASIRGQVVDSSGAHVSGAKVVVLCNGKVAATAISTADGSFEVLTGTEGRFFLVVSANSFRQLQTPEFYAGQLDSVERTIVLEPEWVRQSIVVTATGTPRLKPVPQQMSSLPAISSSELTWLMCCA